VLVAGSLVDLGQIDRWRVDGEQHVSVGTELFDDLDPNVESRQRRIGQRRSFERLGSQTRDDASRAGRTERWQRNLVVAEPELVSVDVGFDQVHRR
jgi:hypothetical protein